MLRSLIFIGLTLIACVRLGQAQPISAEQPLLHVDKSFYVNGEVIWYQLFLPISFVEQEVAVRVSVHDEEGEEISYSFHQNNGQTSVSGYFKVPYNFKTGWYQMVFQALLETEREPLTLARHTLPIYNDNDIRTLERNVRDGSVSPTEPPAFSSRLSVSLKISDQTPEPRSANNLTITVTDANGLPVEAIASVAISNWSLVEPANSPISGITGGEALGNVRAEQLVSDIYQRIQVVDSSGAPRIASVIGVWSEQENEMFFSSRTNLEGVSLLKQPPFSGDKFIQYLGYDKESEDIITRKLSFLAPAIDQPLPVNRGIIDYLQKSQQRKKIFQYYGGIEFDLEVAPQNLEKKVLKGNQSFDIADYESFDNFATFFQENLSPLRFGEDRENNRYTSYMYNPRNNRDDKRFPGRPLFIVDGKATRDANFVGRLDLEQVNTVQLFFRPETTRSQFNVMGANGVVVIEMSGGDDLLLPAKDEANRYRVSGLQRSASFPVFRAEGLPDHQPFFRPQLYWNPSVQIDESGTGQVAFIQSDARGKYRIQVVVQDRQGRRGFQTLIYESGNQP